MISNVLYNRKYRILISDKSNTALDVSDLRCIFRVEKRMTQTPNMAECVIYNLSAETEGVIIEQGYRLVIEAGYSGITKEEENTPSEEGSLEYSQYGVIFDGFVVQVTREREDGVNFRLNIMALDGDRYLIGNFVKGTLKSDSTPRQVIQAISSNANTSAQIATVSPDISARKLTRGKVIFGEPKKYLREIAIDNDAVNYMDDGKIYIIKATDEIPSDMTVILTPEAGLIGTPQQDNGGVHIRSLLNPKLKLRGKVKIDNSLVRMAKAQQGQRVVPLDEDGEYQINSLLFSGDTRGQEWYTDIYGTGRLGNNLLIALNAETAVMR